MRYCCLIQSDSQGIFGGKGLIPSSSSTDSYWQLALDAACVLKKELIDPSVEKVHGWDITGKGSRAIWDTHRTRHKKVNSHHATPVKLHMPPTAWQNRPWKTFLGCFTKVLKSICIL